MMNYVEFFGGSYFLAWCSLWLFWGLVPIVLGVCNYIFRIINRVIRAINIAVRGWPPEHLDADGDQVENQAAKA